MPPVGLLLAVSLTIGLATQSCNVGGTGFTIDDLRDSITVTNASTDHDAYVHLSTSIDDRDIQLASGGSETFDVLAAKKYTLDVYAPNDPSGVTYKAALLDLRSQLQDLTLTPEAPAATIAGAITELSVVQTALQQMHGHQTYQSCSAAIKTGVPSQATITWSTSGLGDAGIWVLSCG